jgi:very-short-patch-repair endonuclease
MVAACASRQWAVFLLADVEHLGLSRVMASDRVKAGRLWRLHHGVYSIVPPRLLRIEGRWLAAVLACGPGAVLSHTDAAALWGMRGIPSGPTHVTVRRRAGRRRRQGIVIHRSSTLLPNQTTTRRGIPITGSARTLADLRRTLPHARYESALRQAEILRLDTGGAGGEEPLLSAFERRLLALCRRHGLPRPAQQQIIGPYTVDFLWERARLIVEMDDFRTHGTRSGFEADRARDAWLVANGYRVIRLTWRRLEAEPARAVALLRRALGLR